MNPNTNADSRLAGQESGGLVAEPAEAGIAIASARDIQRPRTSLPSPPKGAVGKVTVALLGDLSLAPDLDDVQKLNAQPQGTAHTPLMTVIHAVLAKHGGSMTVEELAPEVRKYWNRPFAASPFTPEEFIYVIVRNSDDLRVSE